MDDLKCTFCAAEKQPNTAQVVAEGCRAAVANAASGIHRRYLYTVARAHERGTARALCAHDSSRESSADEGR